MTGWEAIAKSLSHEDQNVVLWRIGWNPLWLGALLEARSELGLGEKAEIAEAAKCVTLAIPVLFGPGEPMETASFMRWDMLCSKVEDEALGSVLVQILSDLSLHPDGRVQLAALHGLGHLNHPGRRAAVDLYLQFHPDLAAEPWIQQCQEGKVM